MDYLIEKEFPAVNIVWATGKRMDHAFNNIISLSKYSPQMTWRLIDNFGMAYPVPKSFKKFFTKGSAISLFGIPEAKGIHSKNLKYLLNNLTLKIPESGSSNEAEVEGIVEITYKSGNLILMETKD